MSDNDIFQGGQTPDDAMIVSGQSNIALKKYKNLYLIYMAYN